MSDTKRLSESEQEAIFQRFIDMFGEESQQLIAIEEMSELTKELSKNLWRDGDCKSKTAKRTQNIQEEIADVLITVRCLRYMFGTDEIDRMIDTKLKRGLERIEKRQEENKQ